MVPIVLEHLLSLKDIAYSCMVEQRIEFSETQREYIVKVCDLIKFLQTRGYSLPDVIDYVWPLVTRPEHEKPFEWLQEELQRIIKGERSFRYYRYPVDLNYVTAKPHPWPGPDSAEKEAVVGQKRVADVGLEGDRPIRRQKISIHPTLDFHFNLFLNLVKNKPDLQNAVELLKSSMNILEAGATPTTLKFHINRVKELVEKEGKDPPVEEAATMLFEVISFRDAL